MPPVRPCCSPARAELFCNACLPTCLSALPGWSSIDKERRIQREPPSMTYLTGAWYKRFRELIYLPCRLPPYC
ncbi:hypothetical protein LY76DRAFT_598956 [Colletotrichum caudatum]|nr:hypothetical protein LY76DRAFT_598956 [Colletotrichum caudatum]